MPRRRIYSLIKHNAMKMYSRVEV